jgi:hypothetical protein
MITLFWVSKGPILEHYQTNSAHYTAVLPDKMKLVILRKYWDTSKKNVVLADNTHSHTAAHTV